MNVASAVARAKERHPEQYCPEPRCLWHTGGGTCPLHAHRGTAAVTPLPDDFVRALEVEAAEEWRSEEEASEAEDRDRALRGERDQDRRAW